LTLREAMNRLFEESMVPSGRGEGRQGLVPVAVDVIETEDAVVVKSDLPGLKPENVDISVTAGVLTIRGEFESEEEEERENVHIRERRYGAFQRSISLPTQVEAEDAEASFKDGVLKITLPKVEEEKPKRIEVKAK
jgi:HSP20 family protein